MALEARPVERAHLGALFDLKVSPAQAEARLVAATEFTLAQQAYEPENAHVWGLWEGKVAVGLLAMIDCRTYPHLEEGDDPQSAYIWRLLIDAQHQGKGYGRAALELAETIAQGWSVSKITLTHVDSPESAAGFYARLGYALTGRIVDGEVERSKLLT